MARHEMTKKFRKLAKKAGFIFWAEGEQGHSKYDIDWGNDYTTELLTLARLLKKRQKNR